MKKIKKIISKIVDKIRVCHMHHCEIKKIKDRRRISIVKSVKLTKEQKSQIDNFFKKNYGKKISYKWHKLYTAISGNFDYRYLPELLYTPDFQFLSNNPRYYHGLQDKNILPLILKGSHLDIKTPDTLFSCSNGIILNSDNTVLTWKQMIEQLSKEKEYFVKPSKDTNSGFGCCLINCNTSKKSKEEIDNILKQYNKNFVIQKKIKNQNDIRKLNPSSLNSFRIITYILDKKIFYTPVILRIGMGDNHCDNAHAGGIFVAVSEQGEIISDGKTEFNEIFQTHPTSGIRLKGYKISNIQKVIDAAKKSAALFPQVGVIDWDIVLDENEDPIIIEANMMYGSIWLIQMSHGSSAFGENTSKILQLIKSNKKTY